MRAQSGGGVSHTKLLIVAAPRVLTSCTTSSITKTTTSSDGMLADQRNAGRDRRLRRIVRGMLLSWPSCLGRRSLENGRTRMTELPAHTTRQRGFARRQPKSLSSRVRGTGQEAHTTPGQEHLFRLCSLIRDHCSDRGRCIVNSVFVPRICELFLSGTKKRIVIKPPNT